MRSGSAPDLSSAEKLRTVVRALVLQRAGAPERFRVLDRTEAALPEEVAALHLKARREVLAEMRTIIEEGVSRGEFRPRDGRLAALSVIGMCNWAAWWFHPGSNYPAEPVADQLAQNAVDMLSYPEGTGSPGTAPCRWSGRTLTTSSASSVQTRVTTRARHGPAEGTGHISPGSKPTRAGQQRHKARQLAKYLRGERPDYAHPKEVFRHLRDELGVKVTRAPKRPPYVPTEAEIRAFWGAR